MLPPDIDANCDRQSAQVITIDAGKHVAAVAICAAICGMCLAGFFWVEHRASKSEEESRLVEYYLLDPHSRTPDELAAWAKFRREHEEK